MSNEKVLCETFEEYKKYSEIEDVIITNKETLEGFIRLTGTFYRRLYSSIAKDPETEYLTEFLKVQGREHCWKDQEGKIYLSGYNEKCVKMLKIKYNYKAIIEDIKEKCYNENAKEGELKYNEFVIMIRKPNEPYIYEKILDTKNKSIELLENNRIILNSRIKTYSALEYHYIEMNEIENIMKIYIRDEKILGEFKRICKSIFVEESEEPIVIYDKIGRHNGYAMYNLSEFIISCMERLSLSNRIIGDTYPDYYRYDNDSEYKKIVKKKKLRCLIINKTLTDKKKNALIEYAKKNGIKNIIVKEYVSDGGYCDENKLEKYMEENMERYKKMGFNITMSNIAVENFLGREILLNILEWLTQ